MNARPSTLLHVSVPALREQLEQARELLEQARYRQALRALDAVLVHALPIVDQLHVLAQRALAQALWKKPEAAIEDASRILATVRADVEDLIHPEIDWDYEKAQDIGHLRFLGAVFQLRGMLYRLRQSPRRAVEDLTLSIYMTQPDSDNQRSYLERAGALIELNECLERALLDLELAHGINPNQVQSQWQLPSPTGHFQLDKGKISFVWDEGQIQLTADKVRLRLNKVSADWFLLSELLGLVN